jgi:hypothetical protein
MTVYTNATMTIGPMTDVDISTAAAAVETAAQVALEALHANTPRVKTRRLESVCGTARAIETALAATDHNDVQIMITDDGGAVASGHKYRAESDVLQIKLIRDVDVWRVNIRADRTWAPKRTGGDSGRRSIRILRDGQSQGRVLR